MSSILYGTVLPTVGSGSGGGGSTAVDPFSLAFAQESVPAGDTKEIPADMQYIRYKNFTVEAGATLTVLGELVVL